MYEASCKSVPYDPECFKKPTPSARCPRPGQSSNNHLVFMQGVGKNAPRHSIVSSRHGSPGSIVSSKRGSPGSIVSSKRGSPGSIVSSKHGSPGSAESSDEDEEKGRRREKQALLDEAKRIRVEERKKTYLWLSIWTAVFGLLMVGLVYYATRKSVPSAVRELLDKDKYAAQWDPKMGVKECTSLDKKFLLFNHQLTGVNLSSWSLRTPSVFFLQDDRDLTYDQACSIESFANLLAELVVYALRLKCAKSPAENPANNLKRVLAEEYKNLVPLAVDGNSYFKGTPLAGSFQCRSKRSVDQAMVITAWRFGGLTVHPDVILKSRQFINFPANQIHVSRHYIVSYLKCSPPLFHLLTRLTAYRQQDFDVQAIAKEDFDALCCAGLCPDVVTNDKNSVCDGHCPIMVMKNISQASQHCPRTWREMGDSLRVSQPPH